MRYYLERCECSETCFVIDQRFLTSFLPWKIANWIETFLVMRIHPTNRFSFHLYHMLEGLVSGIPICCIVYFARVTPFKGPCLGREFISEIPFLICPHCRKTGHWKKFIPPKNIQVKQGIISAWSLRKYKCFRKYISRD